VQRPTFAPYRVQTFGPRPPADDPVATSMWLAAAIPADREVKYRWLLMRDHRERIRDQRRWLREALVGRLL